MFILVVISQTFNHPITKIISTVMNSYFTIVTETLEIWVVGVEFELFEVGQKTKDAQVAEVTMIQLRSSLKIVILATV